MRAAALALLASFVLCWGTSRAVGAGAAFELSVPGAPPRRVVLPATWSDLGLVGRDGEILLRGTLEAGSDVPERPALLVGAAAYGSYELRVDGVRIGAHGEAAGPLPAPRPRVFELPRAVAAGDGVSVEIRFRRVAWASDGAADRSGPVGDVLRLGEMDDLTAVAAARGAQTLRRKGAIALLGLLLLGAGLVPLMVSLTGGEPGCLSVAATALAAAVLLLARSPLPLLLTDRLGGVQRVAAASAPMAAWFFLRFSTSFLDPTPARGRLVRLLEILLPTAAAAAVLAPLRVVASFQVGLFALALLALAAPTPLALRSLFRNGSDAGCVLCPAVFFLVAGAVACFDLIAGGSADETPFLAAAFFAPLPPLAAVFARGRRKARREEEESRSLALERSRERFRRLAARSERRRDQERARLARDLHDRLGQTLTALSVELDLLLDAAREGDAGASAALVRRRLAQALEQTRTLGRDLHPSLLEHFGLAAAVEHQARETCVGAGIALVLDLDPDGVEPSRERDAALLRIVQEALLNVVRHAGARRVRVELRRRGDDLLLAIEDDGRGVPPAVEETHAGLGLLAMRERAEELGGNLRIGTRPEGGTRVEARVPLAPRG